MASSSLIIPNSIAREEPNFPTEGKREVRESISENYWYQYNVAPLAKWSGKLSQENGEQNRIKPKMNGTREITPNANGQKKLTINIDTGSGSTDPNVGTYYYNEGEEVTIEATPAEGWEFNNWDGDVPWGDEEQNEITLTMDENKSIEANFEELVEYTLEINTEVGGSTDPSETGWDPYTYYEGEEVTIEANPDSGWYFEKWTGDVSWDQNNQREITLTMDGDKSITANFKEEKNLSIDITGSGSTTPNEGTHDFEDGEEVTVNTDPDSGWYFEEWTGDVPWGDDEQNEITLTMDEDKSITAVFEEYKDLDIEIDGEGGSVSPIDKTVEDGTEITVEATSDDDWYFEEWTGDVPDWKGGKEINLTMDQDRKITAKFEEFQTLNVEIDGEGGSISPSISDKNYEKGEEETITAKSDFNYYFAGWEGDVPDEKKNKKSITVEMDGEKEIDAKFKKFPWIWVSFGILFAIIVVLAGSIIKRRRNEDPDEKNNQNEEEKYCPSCGSEIDPEENSCSNCGEKIREKEMPTINPKIKYLSMTGGGIITGILTAFILGPILVLMTSSLWGLAVGTTTGLGGSLGGSLISSKIEERKKNKIEELRETVQNKETSLKENLEQIEELVSKLDSKPQRLISIRDELEEEFENISYNENETKSLQEAIEKYDYTIFDSNEFKKDLKNLKEIENKTKEISNQDIDINTEKIMNSAMERQDKDSLKKLFEEFSITMGVQKEIEDIFDFEVNLNSNEIIEAIENRNEEKATRILKESKKKIKDIAKIKNEIKEIHKEEPNIDTRDIEEAIKKDDIDKAFEKSKKLKEKYSDYKEAINELENLDEKKSSLASQLADGEIDKKTYEEATGGIKTQKAELEEKLSKLQEKIIHEDYEKPF